MSDVKETTDPLDEVTKDIKSVDDCWEKVPNKKDGGFYNMETLAFPGLLKEKFPDWAEGLKKAIMSAAEKEKVDYDGRQYWWSQFSGKKQYNRSIPGAGGKGGSGKPMGTTVYIPLNVRVIEAKDITQALVTEDAKGTYKRIIFTDRNPDTKQHEFVVEVYKLSKVFPAYEQADKKEEGKKEGNTAEKVEGADEL